MNIASSTRAKIMTVLLSGLAAGLSGLLLYQSQTQDALPGCGGGSDCDMVLSSRWSLWFGIPVSLMAMMVYTAMLVAVVLRDPKTKRPQHAATTAMAVCAFAAIAAALWFVGVQVFAIHALCKYCMATHAAGVAAAVLCLMAALPSMPARALASASAGALVLVGVLVVGQVLGDPPEAAAPLVQFAADPPTEPASGAAATPEPQDPPTADAPPNPAPVTSTPVPPTAKSNATANQNTDTPVKPRRVKLYGGRLTLDTAGVPHIGNPDAKDVLVVIFDYTCSHCRDTKKMLVKTAKKHGDSLAIFFLAAPLSSKCNRMVKRINPTNRYACELARISLAFWRIAPDKWAEFDRILYSNKKNLTPVRAKIAAGKLINEKDLTKAMEDPWVDQQIKRGVSMYITAAKAAKKSTLPMLITRHGVMNGTPQHPLDVDDLIRGKRRK